MSRCFNNLPSNISWRYVRNLDPEEVSEVLTSYDLMVLPTAGENFGHIILESLAAHTRVLISDQTPWADLEEYGVGWSLSLDNLSAFSDLLTQVIVEKMSSSICGTEPHFSEYLNAKFDRKQIIDNYLRMFSNEFKIR